MKNPQYPPHGKFPKRSPLAVVAVILFVTCIIFAVLLVIVYGLQNGQLKYINYSNS